MHIDFRRDGPKYSPVNHDVVFIRYGKLANKDENACIYERPTDASLARLMASLRKLAPALEAS